MNTTQAIREAIQFIQCSIEHAQECDLENTDDESLHCEFEGIEEMQVVITQLQRRLDKWQLPQGGVCS